MVGNRGNPRERRRAIISSYGCGLVLLSVLVSACGSSTTGGGSQTSAAQIAEAKQLVASYEAKSAFVAPGPTFDASKAKGKTVFMLASIMSVPFVAAVANSLKDALQAAGAKAIVFDGKGQISEQARGIEQAVSLKVDAIVDDGVDESLVRPQFADAKAAGIPVIDALAFDPGPLPSGISPAIVAGGGHCYRCAGKEMADWAIADSNGTAHVEIFSVSSSGLVSRNEQAGMTEEFSRLCPGCKVSIFDTTIAQWNQLTSQTPTILSRDPSINYLLPLFDGQALFIIPAVVSAGKKDKVKLASFNGTPDVLTAIQQNNVAGADVGSPAVWEGWAVADETLRILTGQPAVTDTKIPERLFTKNNIGDFNVSTPEATWYGSVDLAKSFKALWQLPA